MKCVKIEYANPRHRDKPHTILGIIQREDDSFYWVKTAKNEIQIAKRLILSISKTDEDFKEAH